MRHLPLVLAAFLLVSNASAQEYATDKGSILLAGSLDLSSSGESDEDGRSTVLYVNPNLSYFVTPGLAVGANLVLSRFSSGGGSSTTIGIGPQVAYFFGGPTSTLLPFVTASVSYSSVSYSDIDGTSNIGTDVAGGAVFMLARNVGLNAEAFYRALSFSEGGGRDRNAFGFRGGVTAFIF